MRRLGILALVLTAAACAAPMDQRDDAPSPGAGRDCFSVSMVTSYEPVDADTVRLRTGPSRDYEVDLSGGQCRNLDWTQRLAIESTPSSWICVGSQVGQGNVHFRDPNGRRVSCYIEGVHRALAEAP